MSPINTRCSKRRGGERGIFGLPLEALHQRVAPRALVQALAHLIGERLIEHLGLRGADRALDRGASSLRPRPSSAAPWRARGKRPIVSRPPRSSSSARLGSPSATTRAKKCATIVAHEIAHMALQDREALQDQRFNRRAPLHPPRSSRSPRRGRPHSRSASACRPRADEANPRPRTHRGASRRALSDRTEPSSSAARTPCGAP